MKTAMEKEQTRERERYTRTIASGPRQDAEKSSYTTLYFKDVTRQRVECDFRRPTNDSAFCGPFVSVSYSMLLSLL